MDDFAPAIEMQGKRLLVLGGTSWRKEILKTGNKYGFTIVVAGNDPESALTDIADEYYQVDSTSAEDMKKLIRDKKIDGVYLGGNEIVISSAVNYVRELNLPCFCNKKQWDFFQNKSKFKEVCAKNQLPCLNRMSIASADYPVITKPTDGSGSDGFSVCNDKDELLAGIKKARNASPSGNYLIEKFVRNDRSIIVNYLISDDEILCSGICDKYAVKFKGGGSYVGGLWIYESSFRRQFLELYDKKIRAMFSSLNLKSGNVWMEVFYDDNKFWFNEAGYRFGGELNIYAQNYFYNVNPVATDIYYSLTGKSQLHGFPDLLYEHFEGGRKYIIYSLLLTHGIIKNISGENLLKSDDRITNVNFFREVHSVIPDTGAFNQVGGVVHAIVRDRNELTEIVDKIHQSLFIESEDGRNMLLRRIDVNNITF